LGNVRFEEIGLEQLGARLKPLNVANLIRDQIARVDEARRRQRAKLALLHVLADIVVQRGHHLRAALLAG
jgi:hypothetical protein